MRMYNVIPVVKHRSVKRLIDGTAAFSNRSSLSGPLLAVSSGWVFRSIPSGFLAFPSFPVVWPACKIFPDKEGGTAFEKREEKV